MAKNAEAGAGILMKIMSALADFMVEGGGPAAHSTSEAKASVPQGSYQSSGPAAASNLSQQSLEIIMAWTKPEFADIRFGFEITMYIANR